MIGVLRKNCLYINVDSYLIWNTDSITEARNSNQKEYLDRRFWENIHTMLRMESPKGAIVAITAHSVEAFVDDAEQMMIWHYYASKGGRVNNGNKFL